LNGTHNDRTMAWDADLEARIQALTPEQIKLAMRKYLDLAKMTFMRGGDFKKEAAGN
jgi:zinc protease